jgi:hypothetical protein
VLNSGLEFHPHTSSLSNTFNLTERGLPSNGSYGYATTSPGVNSGFGTRGDPSIQAQEKARSSHQSPAAAPLVHLQDAAGTGEVLPDHRSGERCARTRPDYESRFCGRRQFSFGATHRLRSLGGYCSVTDYWKEPAWNVVETWANPYGSHAPKGAQDAECLPSHRFAKAWLTFEKARERPITPLE